MEIFYINQNTAVERRKRVEKMISGLNSNLDIARFEALGAETHLGNLSKGEIGCFRSHEKIVEGIENSNRIIFEDDVVFDNDLISMIDKIDFLLNHDQDIIFFATHTPYFNILITTQMLSLLENLAQNRSDKYSMIDAKNFYRSSTMAYAVSARAKNKIVSEIKAANYNGYNIAIDTFYFKMLQEEKLKGSVIFPFPVSCSAQLTQLTDRLIDGIPQLYDHQLNIFSGIIDHKKMLRELIGSALESEMDQKKLIAALLCYHHFIR